MSLSFSCPAVPIHHDGQHRKYLVERELPPARSGRFRSRGVHSVRRALLVVDHIHTTSRCPLTVVEEGSSDRRRFEREHRAGRGDDQHGIHARLARENV